MAGTSLHSQKRKYICYNRLAMTYEIVRYRPEHRIQLLELQTHLWGPDPALNAAYLEWKYERNPYMGTPFIIVALHEGRVVVACGQFGTRWQIGDPSRTLNWLCGADMVIAPEYQGTDLVGKLIRAVLDELAADGYTHTLNLSAVPVTFWACVKWGWRCPGSFKMLRRDTWRGHFIRLSRGLARRLPVLGRRRQRRRVPPTEAPDDAFASLDHAGGLDGKSADEQRICVEKTPRPEAMAELIAHAPSDERIRHARDETFFAWRFADPFRTFRFLYWDDGGLQGYLVLSARRPTSRRTEISIVDWEATTAQVKQALLRAAIDWGRFDTLTIWSATFPEETQALLRASGFRYVRPRVRDRTGRVEPNWPGLSY